MSMEDGGQCDGWGNIVWCYQKLHFFTKKYRLYTHQKPSSICEYISKNRNCEDIEMSFLVANATGVSPIISNLLFQGSSFCCLCKDIDEGRDRSPYPAHQVLKDLEGSLGFVINDDKAGTIFAALGRDEKVKLFWGISTEGSVMISDDVNLLKLTVLNPLLHSL